MIGIAGIMTGLANLMTPYRGEARMAFFLGTFAPFASGSVVLGLWLAVRRFQKYGLAIFVILLLLLVFSLVFPILLKVGIHAQSLTLLTLAILLAGLVFGPREAKLLTLVSVAIIVALYLAEINQWLGFRTPQNSVTAPFQRFANFLALFIGSGWIVSSYGNLFRQTLEHQQATLKELERHRNHLEALVAEQTGELIKAKEAAETANVAKSAFLANMSHEMRTPLHQAVSVATLIRREPLTPKQTDRLGMMDTALTRLTGIIDTILELTRLEANQFDLTETVVDLDSLIRKAVEGIQAEADAKRLAIVIEVTPMPFNLFGNARHIAMALDNYLSNAIRFTPAGQITVRGITVDENADSALIRIEVEDTGIGITPEDQVRLFNIFEQVDNSSTRKYGGLGAGLAMTKKMAQLMGGDVGCESRIGKGSRFWFAVRVRRG